MSKLPYFLTPAYYPAFLDELILNKLQEVYSLTHCIDNLVARNSDVFHIGKKTAQRVVVYENECLPRFKLIPSDWDDTYIQSDINNNRYKYNYYISQSDTQSPDLKRVSINAHLSYTKETIAVYFIYCSISYWPIARELLMGILSTKIDYELSPYYKLISIGQYLELASEQFNFHINKQGIPPKERVESGLSGDKTAVTNYCDSLNNYTTQIRFLKTRPKFKEDYKQFTREAKRTTEVVKAYLKKITKLADEITLVELKLNAEAFSAEAFESNRSQVDLFEEALDYRKKFLKYLQNQAYFNDIKGLIWRLDYDVSKHQYFYIFHIFFYVLEDKKSKIAHIDNEWKKITKEKGSLEYLAGADQEGYYFDQLDLTDAGKKEGLIKWILAYYERDSFGHVNTHGKKGVSFSKKAIVPVGHNNLKESLKKKSKRLAAKAEEWSNSID